jgi:hypothetical protein
MLDDCVKLSGPQSIAGAAETADPGVEGGPWR